MNRQPSQCDRVLDVLEDGLAHTIQEIHERAGTMRLNSRVAELRKRGHEIVCTREGDDYFYRLSLRSARGKQATGTVRAPRVERSEAETDGELSLGTASEPGPDRSGPGSPLQLSFDVAA